jgi:hypothetical protein
MALMEEGELPASDTSDGVISPLPLPNLTTPYHRRRRSGDGAESQHLGTDDDGSAGSPDSGSDGTSSTRTAAFRTRKRPCKSRWTFLNEQQQELYREALKRKYRSPEDNVASRCMAAKASPTVDDGDELFTPALLDHVRSLWRTQHGLCRFTGRPMMWKQEDVQNTPGNAISVVCLSLKQFGRRWAGGNIALMCADAKAVVLPAGLNDALATAREIAEFSQFKDAMHGSTPDVIFDAWDAKCHKLRGDSRWHSLDAQTRRRWYEVFLRGAVVDRGTRCSDELKNATALHCVDLYERQRGRCALSGVVFSTDVLSFRPGIDDAPRMAADRLLRPSVDRIDCSMPHGIGNLMLTTTHVNMGRVDMPVAKFCAMMCDAVRWNHIAH